jgi:hypothetical protein
MLHPIGDKSGLGTVLIKGDRDEAGRCPRSAWGADLGERESPNWKWRGVLLGDRTARYSMGALSSGRRREGGEGAAEGGGPRDDPFAGRANHRESGRLRRDRPVGVEQLQIDRVVLCSLQRVKKFVNFCVSGVIGLVAAQAFKDDGGDVSKYEDHSDGEEGALKAAIPVHAANLALGFVAEARDEGGALSFIEAAVVGFRGNM